jgi:hypothetical protein
MENETKIGLNPMTLGLIAIVVIAVLAVGALALRPSTTPTTQEAMSSQPTEVVSNDPEAEPLPEGVYEDGTYEEVGDYTSPGGEEQLGVKITLAGPIITDAEVTVLATRPISLKMQEDFAANFKEQVIGKNIDEVMLTKVSGSSLAPKGFNDALEKIKVVAS